ncbi:hypothetical protein CMT45_00955 [Elizabethkingia anophelis]|nr:hypothetical protein [Elizabethkingia anophelis]
MSNKTALQELKLIIESVLDELPRRTSDFENGKEDAFNYVLSIINDNSIEKERQQIMETYHNGQVSIFNTVKNIFPNIPFSSTQADVDKIESGEELNEYAIEYFTAKYGNP